MSETHELVETVDLTNCDREPIHILGEIQSFGCLMEISQKWTVARISMNARQFLYRDPRALLNQPLDMIFTANGVHTIRNLAGILRDETAVERSFGVQLTDSDSLFDLALHFSKGNLVLEFEPSAPATSEVDASVVVRRMISRVSQAQTIEQLLQEAARQVRGATGFDRVMVYRFDERGDGEVVAESRTSRVDSFLGLHYPATDIPAQARTLYVKNTFRIISDVMSEPVAILPQFDTAGKPLDLSLSVTRSVSRIHLEYLKNMGVSASMSISIVVDGKLWGLFACHHYKRLLPTFAVRTAVELFGTLFSLLLESRQRQSELEYEANAREIWDRMVGTIAKSQDKLFDAEWLGTEVAGAIRCDGVGVYIDGRINFAGLTPDEAEFKGIVGFLTRQDSSQIVHTNAIATLIPEAAEYASRAAGLLAIPISRSPRDYVVLFRSEKLQSVRWAGNPEKPVDYGPNGARLTPRKSFEEWSETVKGISEPFTATDLRAANALRIALLEVVLHLVDMAHREREAAAERQTLIIGELNHRVRNILALIRGLLSQTRPSDDRSPTELFAVLDQRIMALARAHDQLTARNWSNTSLQLLIETELEAFVARKRSRFSITGPQILVAPEAFTVLALVFHELITNSVKYGAASDNGRIDIAWALDELGHLEISWREVGGPPVKPVKREGFGSTIIRRSIPHDLKGRADVRFKIGGFEADFCIPARWFEVGAQPDAPEIEANEAAATPDRPLAGKQVLVVEDSMMIALDAEAMVTELGAASVHLAGSVAAALDVLATQEVDFALLDINLGDETSSLVADRLIERGTAFVFASGYGEMAVDEARFAHVRCVTKPYSTEMLRRQIAAQLAEST